MTSVDIVIGGKTLTLRRNLNTECAYREATGEDITTFANKVSGDEIDVSDLRLLFGVLLSDNDDSPVNPKTGLPDAKACIRHYGRLIDSDTLPAVLAGVFELTTGRKPDPPDPRSGAPFVPTPPEMVEKALDMAELRAGDVFLDPLCGDGRTLAAAMKRDATVTAIGYELDKERAELAGKNAPGATVICGDGFEADFAAADVIYLYTLQATNERMQPILLERCKPSCRIVSRAFTFPGWKPYLVEVFGNSRLYAYRISDARPVDTAPTA